MLVDLGRNDVGRVCEYGSVRVPQFMGLERFSHVMHLTSIVEGQAGGRSRSARRAGVVFSGGHRVGRAESARDADHPRARAVGPRALRRRGRLSGLRRQPRFLHRDPHGDHVGGQGLRAGGRRHRHGFESGGGIRGNARQGAGAAARAGAGAGGLDGSSRMPTVLSTGIDALWFWSSTTTIRSPTTSCSTSASSGAEVHGGAQRCGDASSEIARAKPERIVISPGPGRPEDAGVTMDVIRRLGPDDADSRRLPGPSGDRRGVRRIGGARARCRCTARRRRSSTTAAACSAASPAPFVASRYHSLVVAEDGLPADLEVTARTQRGRRRSWDCVIARGRSTACSFIPSRF